MSSVDINSFTPHRKGQYAAFISSENRCTHKGKNPNQHFIRQFKIDGEVFPKGTSTKRCDYLLINDTAKTTYYIELKGSDIPTATVQIDNTVDLLSPSLPDYKVFRRIIYRSSTHKMDENSVVRWKLRHRGTFIIKHDTCEENIS